MTFLVPAGRLRVLGLSLWPFAVEASIGEHCYCLSCGGCWPVVFSWSIAVLSFMRPPSNVMAYHSVTSRLPFLLDPHHCQTSDGKCKRCSFCGRDNEPRKPRVGPGCFGVWAPRSRQVQGRQTGASSVAAAHERDSVRICIFSIRLPTRAQPLLKLELLCC